MAGPQSSSLLNNQVSVGMRAQAIPAQEIEAIELAALLMTGVARTSRNLEGPCGPQVPALYSQPQASAHNCNSALCCCIGWKMKNIGNRSELPIQGKETKAPALLLASSSLVTSSRA